MFFTLLIYCPLFLGCMKVLFIHIGQWFGLINLKLHQLQLKRAGGDVGDIVVFMT